MCLWRASSEADRAARLEQQAAARAQRVRALREERESRRTAAARETSTELAAAIDDLAEVSLAEVSSPAAVEVPRRQVTRGGGARMCLWRAASEEDRAARLERQTSARAERVQKLREERRQRQTQASGSEVSERQTMPAGAGFSSADRAARAEQVRALQQERAARRTAVAAGGSRWSRDLAKRVVQQSRIQQSREREFAESRFSFTENSVPDSRGLLSAAQKMKTERRSCYDGLTKEEKLARRRESLFAADDPSELKGTRERPPKEFVRMTTQTKLKIAAAEAAEYESYDPEASASMPRLTKSERAERTTRWMEAAKRATDVEGNDDDDDDDVGSALASVAKAAMASCTVRSGREDRAMLGATAAEPSWRREAAAAVAGGGRRQSGGAAAPWDEDAPQKTVSVRV